MDSGIEEGHKDLIACALVAAQKEIREVEKDATNQHHRYKYASAEALMAEGREAFHKAGLALCQVGWKFDLATAPPTVSAEFWLTHESGQSRVLRAEYPVIEGNGRPLDKAGAGALTYLEGYLIRGLLCLPRVDEATEEVNTRDDRDHEPAKRGTQRQQEQQAPATGGAWESFDAFRRTYAKAQQRVVESIALKTRNRLREIEGSEPLTETPIEFKEMEREELLAAIWANYMLIQMAKEMAE